ncbi:ADP-ribosylation factor-binding protein GGA1 isoform X2 [Vombatus ursinus]|uniref:Golgi associated, gamma adaptin ear containing, ARF binding protein 1 n=1 Tax=Vombatus ursinus TaxID=29139 RepID=A0A4X2K4M4_VOMUR|nr:ADP-ribosylation factor-binding protein GGA1 isoform X2 [Vombatus ursinus]
MEPESLESRINRATNPLNKELDWDSIEAFCEQLNKELEGPPLATRLLAHKIQSPQEWEATQALTVLEMCMKNCGKQFHDEVGKFRFLNELIKVVSPKYLGTRTPDKVKDKILELLYSWTLGLPQEVKIAEAYQMLKKQGIVKTDPKLPEDSPFSAPPTRPKNGIFEDEEKSKMLARLLKSSHPEDLRAANKLIKEMVQEDQKRMEKISKRVNAIEEVNTNVRLLTEMVTGYSQGETSVSNDELMKELYQRCERMRPMLFRLASDTEDNDEALAEILQANDNLTQVINLYQQLVKGEEVNGDTASGPLPGSTSALLDLSGLDMPPAGSASPALPSLASGVARPEQPTSLSLLDDELMSLGLNDPTPLAASGLDDGGWNSFQSSDSSELPGATPKTESQPLPPTPPASSSGLDDLDLLGKTLLQQSLPPASQQVRWEKQQPAPRLTLRDLQNKSSPSAPTLLPSSSCNPPTPPRPAELAHELSLANITVPLESIRPSSILPVTVYDQHGFRILFHFARDPLPGRPDVLVVVVSMLSTAPKPIRNIVFQSAVPKVMKVKLQPPSGTELPAFNPVFHPAAITQVLLLANPQKEKVRLRYKLTFTLGDQAYHEMGDVDQFPPPESWGSL